jgi:hypothetical protein
MQGTKETLRLPDDWEAVLERKLERLKTIRDRIPGTAITDLDLEIMRIREMLGEL